MKKRLLYILKPTKSNCLANKWLFFLLLFMAGPVLVSAQVAAPADANATPETKMLYRNLVKLMSKGVMYGHQEDLAYGVGWTYERRRSDVKSVTGSYPAVYGWDMGRIELDSTKNLDDVPFADMASFIEDVYKRGGINTISWHINDPVTGKTAWSTPVNSVRLILDSVKYQNAYKAYLDKFVVFLQSLKGRDGNIIPIIFRPFHEYSGNWFWWGKTSCTPAEFIGLWQLTYNYLVNEKQLHNLLFALSSTDFNSESDYMERYPGDAYVDIVGFDSYCQNNDTGYVARLNSSLGILDEIAQKHTKIPALTEFGYNMIPVANWWTGSILPAISGRKLSYMLTWRNWKEDHFFSPYPGSASADDFKLFFDDPKTIFQDDLRSSLYRKAIK